ncbi:MAG: ThuA domain-containing protein [Actinomycetes bacterium]
MRRSLRRALGVSTVALLGLGGVVLMAPAQAAEPAFNVLVFSKTAGFRHSSIPTGIQTIRQLGEENGFAVDATEDATAFTSRNLRQYDAVVWLSTTGDVLNATQQEAFEGYIRAGGGYAGIHAAADTEYDWPFYGDLVGAYFKSHPAQQTATVRVEDPDHPSTRHLPEQWSRFDEWYNYRANPRGDVHVLATLDESSYAPGPDAMADHPIAWCHDVARGRSWYTGGGHTEASYAEPEFRQHLLGGIQSAAGAVAADCGTEDGYRSLFDGTAGSLERWRQAGPGGFTLADGVLTSFGGLGMLWNTEEFETYSLRLDWMMPGDDNSGVFVGFPASDDPWSAVDQGYEIQIDATDDADSTTGAVYNVQAPDEAARDAALNPPGKWNTFRIDVVGQTITVYLNDTKINEFTNTDPARDLSRGHVGIQNHGDADAVSFRDIRVKDL